MTSPSGLRTRSTRPPLETGDTPRVRPVFTTSELFRRSFPSYLAHRRPLTERQALLNLRRRFRGMRPDLQDTALTVIDLRLAGHNSTAIAHHLGITRTRVYQLTPPVAAAMALALDDLR